MKPFAYLFMAGLALSALGPAARPAGAQTPPATGNSASIYSDVKAGRVGDVLSVIIAESNSASKNSRTSTQKQNKAAASGSPSSGALNGLFPGAGGSMDFSDQYNGQGAISRTGQLNSRISVRVVEILPNRDLVVEGSKTLEINEDMEVVTLSGVVRAADISAANTVYSYQVGNAKLTYKGKGSLSTAQRPGILTRIINWIL
jgi:flagellar L-ring protein precursor FlgH